MNKPIALAFIIIGVILLGYAAIAGDSVSSGFSKLFQGTPDNRTLILLVLGILALISGVFGIMGSRKA